MLLITHEDLENGLYITVIDSIFTIYSCYVVLYLNKHYAPQNIFHCPGWGWADWK